MSNWRKSAACIGVPELFFIGRGESSEKARSVCASCPVTPECLDFSIVNSEPIGIWGGKSKNERIEMMRRRKAA